MKTHQYHINIAWNEGRKGVMCSPELGAITDSGGCIQVATPPEFPHGIPGIWSPEHLFTAAVGSCLMTTFLAVAENSKLAFTAFKCSAVGMLSQVEGKYLMEGVELVPSVTITDEKDRALAEKVLKKSADACLISNSVKSTITVKPKIVVGATVAGN